MARHRGSAAGLAGTTTPLALRLVALAALTVSSSCVCIQMVTCRRALGALLIGCCRGGRTAWLRCRRMRSYTRLQLLLLFFILLYFIIQLQQVRVHRPLVPHALTEFRARRWPPCPCTAATWPSGSAPPP